MLASAPPYKDVLVAASVEIFPAPIERNLWLVLIAFVAVGIVLTVLNLQLPISRNSLEYAKAALEISEHHFNLLAVVHDRAWSSGKPIIFALLAAPFVRPCGAGVATLIASSLGTIFFLWMVIFTLARLNRRSGLGPTTRPLELALVALNPLVLYQFWSAYPDSLFAGLVLLAFNLTDHIAVSPKRDTRWQILALGVTIDVAIHTKLFGAVLMLACPFYLLLHSRELIARSSQRRSKLALLCVVFAALAVDLGTAALRINPLLDFADGAGFGSYKSGLADGTSRDIRGALSMLGFAVLLVFQVALPFLATPAARRAWRLAPAAFAAIYLLGLLPFPGTNYNMRYFMPVFPFLAVPIAAGVKSLALVPRRTVLAGFGALAVLLVLIFNVAEVEERVQPVLSAVAPPGGRLNAWLEDWLDNLRLASEIELRKQIQAINTEVPGGRVLFWASDYNKTASHGLAEHLGVEAGRLDIRYVLHPAFVGVSPDPVYLTEFTSYPPRERLSQTPGWATAQSLGHGVFRLDPISAELVSVSGDYVAASSPIGLQARLTTRGTGLKIGTVKFFEADQLLGEAREPPYTLNWENPSPGRHQVDARVSYGDGDVLTPQPLVVYVGVPALERGAGATNGVTAERTNGIVEFVDDAVDLTARSGTVGVRFDRLAVPYGTHIADTYLEIIATGRDATPAELVIQAELSADAAPLSFDSGDLSRRQRTTASVSWHPNSRTAAVERQRSPNLAPILDEVFAQAAWRPGNAVVLLIRGCGRRAGHLSSSDGVAAPRLYVELRPVEGSHSGSVGR
jgi:hypothetical protein